MLARIGSKVTVKRILKIIERDAAGSSHLLETLAYIAVASPTTIPLMLDRGILPAIANCLQSTNSAELALALRLFTFFPPHKGRATEGWSVESANKLTPPLLRPRMTV